jgi:hypothetical protein
MSSILALVATLISESEQSVLLAESEQWDAFSELEKIRQEHIQELDLRNVNLSEQEDQLLREQMALLITLNDKIEAICREKRSEAVTELKKINQGNKAKKAYS